MAIVEVDGIEIDTDKVKIEDMPTNTFKEIYNFCGSETAVLLMRYMAGNLIQVPAMGFRKIIKRIILNDYDGTTESLRRICRTHKMTETHVRNILKDLRVDPPLEGQKSFNFNGGNEYAE